MVTVCRVEASQIPEFQPGDIVEAYTGWQEYALSDGRGVRKLDPSVAPDHDGAGRARDAGHDRLDRAHEHRAAEGRRDRRGRGGLGRGRLGRGSARQAQGLPCCRDCRRRAQMPICRGRARVRRLHRPPPDDFAEALNAACPKGIDINFENVGGLSSMPSSRSSTRSPGVPVCGLIAHYNATELPTRRRSGPAAHASGVDQAADAAWVHRVSTSRTNNRISWPRSARWYATAASSTARTSSTAWRTPRAP